MTEVQEKLLDMLAWFDRFCRENSLRYYALGGTLLGALRHSGFIPWDDDIDLGLPRPDYEKLARLMEKKDGERYILETEYSDDEKYCYPFAKLYDTQTTLAENVSTGLKRGLYLDIFPIDGIGNGEQPDMQHFSRIKRLNQFYLARIASVRRGRSFFGNAAAVVAKAVPKRIADNTELRKKISGLCRKYDYENSRWAGNLVGNWWEKEIVPQRWFGDPKEYPFEGITILGVEYADEYLTAIYGDWRKLPPEEKRISHHDYILCDLYKSYLTE